MRDWASAAAGYENVLGKGMNWNERYKISLSLADCYAKTGRCTEALNICDGLLAEVTTTKEKPPVMLGRAASHVCMDSLQAAIREYNLITESFPRSNYSAEAFFRLGVIYHEKLDSLQLAQTAYSKVSNESASSEYAAVSLQRSSSLNRLIELQKTSGENEGEEAQAEKRFLAAEIQLTRLNETDLAMGNYRAVVDSFPLTSYAPLAAYALGWIYRMDKGDTAQALEAFTHLIREYPVSPQARGALYEVHLLGEEELKNQLEAYVDSAVADTARVAARKEEIRAEAAASAAASTDSTVAAQPAESPGAVKDSIGVAADGLGVVADSVGVAADSLGTVPVPSDTAAADSTGTGKPAPADSVRVPSREDIKKKTTYPTGGTSDTTGTRKTPRPPGENNWNPGRRESR
jgi:TolA-binding protein